MSTKRKLSPNAKTRKNIKRIKAQKAVLDRSRSSNSINSAATKSSNTLVLGGANRFMPERYHNIMEVMTPLILCLVLGWYNSWCCLHC